MQMQNAGIVIIAIIIAAGFTYALYILATYFITSDKARHFRDGFTTGLRQARLESDRLKTSDLNTLLAITNTLRLAHSTWLPMQGTEPVRARVVTQLAALNEIAKRIGYEIQTDLVKPTAAEYTSEKGEAA